MLQVIPAYGRDYKSAKAAKQDWMDGKDFIVADISDPYDGKPVNIHGYGYKGTSQDPLRQTPKGDNALMNAYERGYPSFSSVGGYTIIYLDPDDNAFCADCASERQDIYPGSGHPFWEGPDMYCDECSVAIESSYGDPDEEEGES